MSSIAGDRSSSVGSGKGREQIDITSLEYDLSGGKLRYNGQSLEDIIDVNGRKNIPPEHRLDNGTIKQMLKMQEAFVKDSKVQEVYLSSPDHLYRYSRKGNKVVLESIKIPANLQADILKRLGADVQSISGNKNLTFEPLIRTFNDKRMDFSSIPTIMRELTGRMYSLDLSAFNMLPDKRNKVAAPLVEKTFDKPVKVETRLPDTRPVINQTSQILPNTQPHQALKDISRQLIEHEKKLNELRYLQQKTFAENQAPDKKELGHRPVDPKIAFSEREQRFPPIKTPVKAPPVLPGGKDSPKLTASSGMQVETPTQNRQSAIKQDNNINQYQGENRRQSASQVSSVQSARDYQAISTKDPVSKSIITNLEPRNYSNYNVPLTISESAKITAPQVTAPPRRNTILPDSSSAINNSPVNKVPYSNTMAVMLAELPEQYRINLRQQSWSPVSVSRVKQEGLVVKKSRNSVKTMIRKNSTVKKSNQSSVVSLPKRPVHMVLKAKLRTLAVQARVVAGKIREITLHLSDKSKKVIVKAMKAVSAVSVKFKSLILDYLKRITKRSSVNRRMSKYNRISKRPVPAVRAFYSRRIRKSRYRLLKNKLKKIETLGRQKLHSQELIWYLMREAEKQKKKIRNKKVTTRRKSSRISLKNLN